MNKKMECTIHSASPQTKLGSDNYDLVLKFSSFEIADISEKVIGLLSKQESYMVHKRNDLWKYVNNLFNPR